MKIAILGSRGYPSTYGGFETLVRYLAQYLQQRGHRVEVYGRTEAFGTVGRRAQTIDGVTVRISPGMNTTSASTLTFGCSSAIHAALRSRPDVVIAVNVAMGLFLPILKRAGIPTIINVDGMEWERAKWGPTARRLFRHGARLAAKHADVLIADSTEVACRWETILGRRPLFIPYGGEALAEIDCSVLEEYGLTEGGYVLVVARLVPENSIELVLDAAKLMRSGLPLVVVGTSTGGDRIQRLVSAAAEHGQIQWLGHVHSQPRLHALWRHCAAYVHGHTSGGTNPALLQAMANRAPVVALNTPFSREVLGADYPLCEATAEALAAQVDAMVNDDGLREHLRARGVRRVESNYVWDQVCAEYEAVSLGLLRGP